MIIADDLNPALGCFGNETVKTPNIDRLASRGMLFSRAYAPWASCLVSRYSMLSGWYPTRTGAQHRVWPSSREGELRDAVYLPQHFKRQSYFTARLDKVFHIGKDDPPSWNITEEPYKDATGSFKPVTTGQEIPRLGLEGRVLRSGNYQGKVSGEPGGFNVMDARDEELFDGITAKRAVEILRDRARAEEPFFLAVGFRRPHLPWIAPKRYFDMYPPETIPLPPRAPEGGQQPADEQVHREMLSHYYAAVSCVDNQIGLVLSELERLGLAGNTIVVLFGDNGYCLGERGSFFSKGNLWERSLHVPLIVAGPGILSGERREVPVGLYDLYPTLVDLCGLLPPPTRLDGRSLKNVLAGDVSGWREGTLSFYNLTGENSNRPARMAASLRTARFRYTADENGSAISLHDLEADPYERENVVNDPRFKDAQARFHGQVLAALAERVPPPSPGKQKQ
jgi:arylsulfatase A-like enzyme